MVDQQQQSRWRPTGMQLLLAGATVGLLIIAILIGYIYDITLWDWIKLLIVPAVIAVGGLWFNAQQRERELNIANNRAQEEALQAYLNGISELLTDKDRPLHRARSGDSLSSVARARTLTVLPRLSNLQKASVVHFLYESGLIFGEHPVLDLRGASLSEALLASSDLRNADLSGAWLTGADLQYANLRNANLSRALLYDANLSSADLSEANLREAVVGGVWVGEEYSRRADVAHLGEPVDLGEPNVRGAYLRNANLRNADLSRAYLRGTDLRRAVLYDANLSRTNLTDAYVSEGQLLTAKSLEGATMPNGQKYEDWLKSKDRKEDG